MDFIKNLGDKEAQAFIENNKELVILDVRRYNEFKAGNIPNSINIPVEELEWEIEQLEDYKDKPILVYCRAGHRSVVACNILNDAGFEKLYNLSYGTLGYTGRLEPI
ncbi:MULTISPECIES: rhodanese-like domain-containing protein [Clostridium]|uniref:rhodanese-like domain-containing protein n=1 Tax=Clostridium TaxID=1485 RepID=UPI000C06F312|nr:MULTISPECIES: rhodanese-like domain-containing protein [Clostridium]MDB2092066.1 rhodanese-like domain-containing protein [Clostridium paraputrificum]MDB2121048.1 rhodanese-like domain-containing protein [Clostridium paraputrificum]MDU2755878.1 rhodanese-like domain-containing protein [Clostridium sp.]MDU2901608.1 rhodanese-like domain-containing protein [Clostridium sp.]MDU3409691.1 rhodanese-like domain-containing protein [Clostridium sp.]